MGAKYIKSTSELSPKNVWSKLEGGEWSFDDCPWVILKNLYAAVNFTGDGSWQYIAKDLFNKGQKNFVVLSGRHGDQLGQQVDTKTGKFKKREDGDTAIDPEDDKKVAGALMKGLKGINIVVVDVGSGSHDSVDLLTKEIAKHLAANKIVILAWCYSLYAMEPGWDINVKNAWPQVFSGPNMTPISHISKAWAWVSKYAQLPASVAAEKVAVP